MGHSKEELLNSTRRKGKSSMGPGHDGGAKPGHYSDKPVLVSHPHSDAARNMAGAIEQTHVKADLGKAPKVKRAFTDQIPVHTSAERMTSSGVAFGADHSSALDALTGAFVPAKGDLNANPHALPLTKIAPGKPGMGPVAIKPGMRSRTTFDPVLGGGEPGESHARAQRHKDAFASAHAELGRRVVEEALAVAGSDHPENMRRAVAAQQTIGRRK